MMRWDMRLENYNCSIIDGHQLHDFLDTLYVTYQNIFHLKDWLYKDSVLDKELLNYFVNTNTEIGICRDIANGTKHFTLGDNFSVDKYFLISVVWNPLDNQQYFKDRKIRIISKAGLFDPFGLSKKCIALWTTFLTEQKLLESSNVSIDDLLINPEYYEANAQTIFGGHRRRRQNSR